MAEIILSRSVAPGITLPAAYTSRSGGNGPGAQPIGVPGGVEPAAVREAAESLKRRMSVFDRRLDFSVDHELDKVVVRVIDEGSGEVIRQIPPEEVLRAAKVIDKLIGILFDERY